MIIILFQQISKHTKGKLLWTRNLAFRHFEFIIRKEAVVSHTYSRVAIDKNCFKSPLYQSMVFNTRLLNLLF